MLCRAFACNPSQGLGCYVYCTFTFGQAYRIGRQRYGPIDTDHSDNWDADFVVWGFFVPKEQICKVERHPEWCGMAPFLEVCVNAVPAEKLTCLCMHRMYKFALPGGEEADKKAKFIVTYGWAEFYDQFKKGGCYLSTWMPSPIH